MTQKNVSIVGGGIAGLACAYYLSKEKNLTVTVLESTDRFGGRLYTSYGHNTHNELGGFITFSWYTYTRNIINDLGFTSQLKKLTNAKEQYWNINTEAFELFDQPPVAKVFIRALIRNPRLLRSITKSSFYEPDVSSLNGVSAYELIAGLTKNDTQQIEYLEQLVQGYCYGSLHELPASLYLGFLGQFMRRAGFADGYVIEGGIQQFIDALVRELESRGVTLIKNQNVSEARYLQVDTTEGTSYSADILVRADGIPASLLQQDSCSYTRYYSVSGEINNGFDEEWMAAYLPTHRAQRVAVRLVSFGQAQTIAGIKNEQQFIACLKVESLSENYKNSDIEQILKDELALYLPSITISRVYDIKKWERTMPVVSINTIRQVSTMQGKDNTYYIGDYFSAPCIETAIYSAHKIASGIISKG